MRGKKTFMEESEVFAAELKKRIQSRSKHEGVQILLKKVKYWYWSAIDWRDSYDQEKAKKERLVDSGKTAIARLEYLKEEAKQHAQSVRPEIVKAFHSGMETAFDEAIAILYEGGRKW